MARAANHTSLQQARQGEASGGMRMRKTDGRSLVPNHTPENLVSTVNTVYLIYLLCTISEPLCLQMAGNQVITKMFTCRVRRKRFNFCFMGCTQGGAMKLKASDLGEKQDNNDNDDDGRIYELSGSVG